MSDDFTKKNPKPTKQQKTHPNFSQVISNILLIQNTEMLKL